MQGNQGAKGEEGTPGEEGARVRDTVKLCVLHLLTSSNGYRAREVDLAQREPRDQEAGQDLRDEEVQQELQASGGQRFARG